MSYPNILYIFVSVSINATLCYAMLCYAMLSISVQYTCRKGKSNAGMTGSAVRVMVVAASPHDAPAVTTVDTDAVVWADRDADVGCFIFAPASPLGVTTVTSAIAPLRLNDKPSLASAIILLLHELKLRTIASCRPRAL